MPGPLPDENARRVNAPTLPTDSLPLDGRVGDIPDTVEELKTLERQYYVWAWSTPAAAAWHESDAEIVAEWARLKALIARYMAGEIMKGESVAEVPSAILSQITNREDRLMLSPIARKKGRAKIVPGDVQQAAVSGSSGDGVVVTPDRWKRAAS
jgi:hypothetical protein